MGRSVPHWGILRVAGHAGFIQPMIEKYLPPDHQIIASHDADGDVLYRQYIIDGPDMPPVEAGKNPELVELLFLVEEAGTFCYWKHMDHKRWPVHQDLR
jgi:hypothetical protein